MKRAYAYCHGFLSGPSSSKGRFLASALAWRGVSLALLDLNLPDGHPASLSHEGALSAIDEFWKAAQRESPGTRLCLVGSSFGGWAAAAYAHRHPERVSRCLLLCPGFELGSRWQSIVGGADELLAWERDGARTFLMPHTGAPVRIPWRFAADSMRLDVSGPLVVRCPTAIIHGLQDDVVPADVSRRFASCHACVSLSVLDDDHWLCQPASLERIQMAAEELFELSPAADDGAALATGSLDRQEEVFEAERKLVVRDAAALEAALSSAAAVSSSAANVSVHLVEETMFIDVYYDDTTASLARRGAWLRQRAGRWELKLEAGTGAGAAADGVADTAEVHRELIGAASVLGWLRALPEASASTAAPQEDNPQAATATLSGAQGASPGATSDEPPGTAPGTTLLEPEDSDAQLRQLLRRRGVAAIAAFGTTRRRWCAGDLMLDLDRAWTISRELELNLDLDRARTPHAQGVADESSALASISDASNKPHASPFYEVLEIEALGPTAATASARLKYGIGPLLERLGAVVGSSPGVVEGKLERYMARYRAGGAHAALFSEYRKRAQQ